MQNARYALLSDAYPVALCQDVDGLYADPAPTPPVRYELRGCEPRGELARAVTEALVEGTAPLGPLDVEVPDGLWRLDGVRVVGARGDAVTVETTGEPRRRTRAANPARCANLIRVPAEPPADPARTGVTFLGCSPRGALREALAAGAEGFGPVDYRVLARIGDLHHGGEAGRVTGWAASARHHDLVDLTVDFPRTRLVPPQTRGVWELFFGGRPAEPGTWRRFSGAARAEWLRQAARRPRAAAEPVPGAVYELDGTDVVDEVSFLCALGEAVYGPGRDPGAGAPGGAAGPGAPGAFGPEWADVTLVWHRADVARACLGVQPWNGPRPATFQELADALRKAGVRLVLD
ncbi:hypothetical protein [Streptomyces sp. NPDC018038]|uniref:hypothetical protein n=1 Tax=Streptomyces sp. NPDC018038 TaxID=3365036 RepID=UPI00379C1376